MFNGITQKAYYALSEDVIRKRVFNRLTNVGKKICYEKLEKLYPLFSVPTWITVGTEIEWTAPRFAGDRYAMAGKVTKITDKSISISTYEPTRIISSSNYPITEIRIKWTTKIASKITHTTYKNYRPKTEYYVAEVTVATKDGILG
jgi:hypothetical protein